MLKKFVRLFGGDPNKKEIDRYSELVNQINALEPQFEALSSEALKAKTAEFRDRLRTRLQGLDDERRKEEEQNVLNELLPEAFAAVREASKRTIGLRHYDVQLIGGAALHEGKIAEMRTGEGKTLVATLPLYLNALTGRGVHLVTVNDYLARRDARWMAPVFNALGLTVGVLQMAAHTENGKKAFIVDLERESPHEDQHQLRMVPRAEAYAADITYGTNSEFGFDYLRDNMTMRLEDRVQRGHYYAIIDEVDNVLIDEARTPLIISGPAQDEAEWYIRMAQVVRQLRPEDYEVDERDRTVTLTEIGESHVEELIGMPLRDPDRPEDVTHEQARLLGYLEQALRAQFLFKRNKDYLVQGGKVVIIDEFTGRLMFGRRWSDGLHQAVEAKEGVKVQSESITYATITIQNYFRMYQKLAGMTGTAVTEAEEFDKIYKLEVLAIPTNLEYQARRPDSDIIEVEAKDEMGYRYQYYARKDDPSRKPIFWRRKDYPDVIYRTEEAKLRAIAQEILRYHVVGRPVLVGTTSVELSERLSDRLRSEPIRRLAQVLLIRRAWFQVNNREEDGRAVPELQFLNGPLEKLDITSMRKMARELGISFNPEDPANLDTLCDILMLTSDHQERLKAVLQGGIPHNVLNAKYHTEESQIIAGAGAFGAVTIATNMAGRGVDIKLGGELAEEILAAVNRVIARSNTAKDPFEMTMEERRQAILSMNPEDYGIYETEIQYFLKYMEDMEKVRELGGLHVIGSERHEARRIDNQLRGRAARQGDPGSSRFYLSMEDELMRLFGGAQADSLMQRMKIDDALPLEVGLVGRIVEQSQTRVEGANFDVRKHLLEYDDVLNTQRSKIYAQRNRVFTKEDLSDDVTEMLRAEVQRRAPLALEDEEGPWKLLAWLEQIQPPLITGETIFPSYTYDLLAEHAMLLGSGQIQAHTTGNGRSANNRPSREELAPSVLETISRQAAFDALLTIARNSIEAEREHLLNTVNNLLAQTEERLESQLAERLETLDTFIEGLSLNEEQDQRPSDVANDLIQTMRMPLRLSNEQQRQLLTDPEEVAEAIRAQVENIMVLTAVTRLVGAVERRLDESLDLDPARLIKEDWDEIASQILNAIEKVFNRRIERYLGDGQQPGSIQKELEAAAGKIDDQVDRDQLIRLLIQISQGTRTVFDKKTHRRMSQRTTRLTYLHFAASFLENRDPQEVVEDVLHHLEDAQEAMRQAWGEAEISRLGGYTPADLDETTRKMLTAELGADSYQAVQNTPLQSMPPELKEEVVKVLGSQALTAIYRQLLLRVISELWVEYLTQMEALRVSIGLEAYGQRDPLVQYKNRAFELFQNLLADMRSGVVTRMFTYRPREMNAAQASAPPQTGRETAASPAPNGDQQAETPEPAAVAQETAPGEPKSSGGSSKKKKKKKRR